MTAVSSAAVTEAAAAPAWPWPLDLDSYDRQGELTTTELNGLRALGLELLRRDDHNRRPAAWRSIRRLVTPLDAARAAVHWHPDSRRQRRFARDAAALVLTHCADQQQAFWDWSA